MMWILSVSKMLPLTSCVLFNQVAYSFCCQLYILIVCYYLQSVFNYIRREKVLLDMDVQLYAFPKPPMWTVADQRHLSGFWMYSVSTCVRAHHLSFIMWASICSSVTCLSFLHCVRVCVLPLTMNPKVLSTTLPNFLWSVDKALPYHDCWLGWGRHDWYDLRLLSICFYTVLLILISSFVILRKN